MTLFVDNDVIKKLASLDLLDEALAAMGKRIEDTYVLDTARFKFNTGKPAKGVASYGIRTHPRICKFVLAAKPITDNFDPSVSDILAEIDGIDPQDAVLLSAAHATEGSLLTTGDKRCLRALAGAPSARSIASSLAGRVICVEQVISRVINSAGFETVIAKVVPGLTELQDTAVKTVFGSGATTTQRNAEMALDHHIRELRAETGALLID